MKNLHNLTNITNEQTKQNMNSLIDAGDKRLVTRLGASRWVDKIGKNGQEI